VALIAAGGSAASAGPMAGLGSEPAQAHVLRGVSLDALTGVLAPRGPAPAFPQAPGVSGPEAIGYLPAGVSIHGVGGDTRIVFLVLPAPAPGEPVGAYAIDRTDGAVLGRITPPPAGWRTPLSIEIEHWREDGSGSHGSFLLLDAGGPPSSAGQVRTVVHRYRYAYDPPALTTMHVASYPLPLATPEAPRDLPTGIVYTDGFVRLPDGSVAVNDTPLGAIWVAGPSLANWRLAAIDADFLPAPAAPATVVGRAPGGGTRETDFWTPGGIYPGVHSMTYAGLTDEVCMVRTAPPGGIFCMARETLFDTRRPALGKPKRTLVPPQIGLSDATDGLVWDRHHPRSRWVYWARAVADVRFGGVNVLRRVDLTSGHIEEVARSNILYDFTNNLAALPPVADDTRSVIASAVGQQQNNAALNPLLLGRPAFVAPSPIPLVRVPAE